MADPLTAPERPSGSGAGPLTILPLLLLIPALFIAGIAFGYFVVLPAATKFLLNFNNSQFNIQVRAKDYYSFFAQTLIACGVVSKSRSGSSP